MRDYKEKQLSWDAAKEQVKLLKKEGAQVVFTNGCFDIIHAGHVDYMQKAARLGDALIVGLNTDASVRKLKGASRPINDQSDRADVISALESVDMLVLFDEDTPLELIEFLGPDILAKGADYAIDSIVGADHVLKSGGRVERSEVLEGRSTSRIIERIKNG